MAHNGCKYIVVLMQYICCYSLVKLLFYHIKKKNERK